MKDDFGRNRNVQLNVPPFSLGVVLALGVFFVALILALLGHMTWMLAGFLMALALARLT